MKFRYLIVDWEFGEGIVGTNDPELAKSYAEFATASVIDIMTGKDISTKGHRLIEEAYNFLVSEEEQADPDDEASLGRTVHPSLLPDPDEDTPFDER